MQAIVAGLAAAVFAAAAFGDIRHRRIPNGLVLAIGALGIGRMALAGDAAAAVMTLLASAAVLAVGVCAVLARHHRGRRRQADNRRDAPGGLLRSVRLPVSDEPVRRHPRLGGAGATSYPPLAASPRAVDCGAAEAGRLGYASSAPLGGADGCCRYRATRHAAQRPVWCRDRGCRHNHPGITNGPPATFPLDSSHARQNATNNSVSAVARRRGLAVPARIAAKRHR